MKRLIRQYVQSDLGTMSDLLAAILGNVENAFVIAGQKSGVDYTFSDILSMTCAVIQSPKLVESELILDDIDRTDEAVMSSANRLKNAFNSENVEELNRACNKLEKLSSRALNIMRTEGLDTFQKVQDSLNSGRFCRLPNVGALTLRQVTEWADLCRLRKD